MNLPLFEELCIGCLLEIMRIRSHDSELLSRREFVIKKHNSAKTAEHLF